MEQQPVYMNLETYNGLRLMQQNSEDQQLQQQQQQYQSQGIIMSDQTQQEVIIQEADQSQQHVVYSTLKPADQQPQYITQEEPMQSQYLIQTQSPQQGQVFFANLSPPNQNRVPQPQSQQIHGLINQSNQNQQKLVIQAPKVVVQRNPDMLQTATSMAQIENQQIQYQFASQMEQTQPHLIVQPQQIKQTIYPHQVVSSQPHYFQLQQIQQQPNVVQQGGTKILMHGSPVRYSFIQKPQQQNQVGQIMQINQQPQQIQTQNVPRQFTPRMVTSNPLRIRVQSPQGIQAPKPILRTPRSPRIVRPAQSTIVQSFPQQSRQTINRMIYMLQNQPDGTSMLVPHPQFTSQRGQPQQLVRMVQQKVVQKSPQNQFQVAQNQMQELAQQQAPQPVPPPDETQAPATSTYTPKKDGDCDDLEDSITATAISKSTRSEPPPLAAQSGVSMSLEEYRKRGIALQQAPNRVGVGKPLVNNAVGQLKSPNRNPALQVIRTRPIPRPQFQQQGMTEIEVPERESAKMLVILDNGEQRLITFTLPKETCTVQELLDQVGIHVGADSNIECIENPGSEIDYIVKVGNFATRDTAAMTKAAENHIRQQQQRQQLIQNQRNNVQQQSPQQTQQVVQVQSEGDLAKSKSPDLKLPPPKYVTGYYAVCAACGFSGADHAKCERCHRIFTEIPKMQKMPATAKNITLQALTGASPIHKIITARIGSLDKKDQMEAIQRKHQVITARNNAARGRGGMLTPSPRTIAKNPRGPRKPIIPEVVTLSSDEEDDSDGNGSKSAKALKEVEKVPKKYFEPDIEEDVVADDFVRQNVTEFSDDESNRVETSFTCRTIRIGTYKFDSKEKVIMTSKGVRIVAPSPKNPKDLNILDIQQSEIIKVVVHFSKQLHIIFIYTKPSCAKFIVEQLQMVQGNDKSPYFSPVSRSEPQRKIVFLAEAITEETKSAIRAIYPRSLLEEINNRDANEMLVRSTGIPLVAPPPNATPNTSIDTSNIQDPEVKKLFIYPPGRGGIAINTNDYVCLGSDNYLNDVIIDFFLKYLHNEILTDDQRAKTHIFSQFFYKRLTTMQKEKDPKLTAAQKRHLRVASWTKNVNIFDKDFVIIPINEQSHWFLAIICFPNLTEPHTMEGNQPIKLVPAQKRAKKKAPTVQIGSTTITPLSKREDTIHIGDDENSERDEAEGDESDLGSNLESEEEEEVVDQGQAVKVPCILIFDSLSGAPRARVVATLRDYLGCEFKSKFPNLTPRIYNRNSMSGNQVKVPQQNNFTDCGVFLLQYVEQFFKDPIKDFRIPIKMPNWFSVDIVTRKREEIAKLIQELIKRTTPDGIELPELEFPTKDGKILEAPDETTEALDPSLEEAFDDEEYLPTEEELKESESQNNPQTKRIYVKKRSFDKNDSSSSESPAKTPKLALKTKP